MKEGRQEVGKEGRKVEDRKERKDSSVWGSSGQGVPKKVGSFALCVSLRVQSRLLPRKGSSHIILIGSR